MLRDGIFTPLERAQRLKGGLISVLTERGETHRDALLEHDDFSQKIQWDLSKSIGLRVKPSQLIEKIGEQITADFESLGPNTERLLIDHTAIISDQAAFDTSAGPIVIGAGARVSAFSLVVGPAYLGANTQLDRCTFTNSIAGQNCRLGGEIVNSIIGDFSNKHHEGFLGHSLVGDWVNLGALTTTSDLKNNYGEVRLTYRDEIYPTGVIKFGAVIGDYAKTAIGTLFGTGTVVDFGANIFGEPNRSGYVKAFMWGKNQTYDRAKFISDAARMMQRRNREVSESLERLISLVA